MTYLIGIDPGLTGAIALLRSDDLIDVWDMPALPRSVGKGHQVNPYILNDVIGEIWDYTGDGADLVAWIEQVGSRPGQGVASMFKFGHSVGIVEGVLAAHQIPVRQVTPARWKKHFNLTKLDKDAARSEVISRYPRLAGTFGRKKDVGRADAALIGLYGAAQ